MVITKITKEIEPLSRFEKLQLIAAISEILMKEEAPREFVDTEMRYPIFTPFGQEKAASQLQQFINQNLP